MEILSEDVMNGWTLYHLKSENVKVQILNYGATLVNLSTKDHQGKFNNIVLSYDDLSDYEQNEYFFGSIIGRVAGRIKDGKFSINDQTFQLDQNEGEHHLHGGESGFHNKLWTGEIIEHPHCVSLKLTHESKAGEAGYPANVKAIVYYHLYQDGTLEIEYEAEADEDTIITLTNHTYFNLQADHTETIDSHEVTMNTSRYLTLNEALIAEKVQGVEEESTFNFKQARSLADGLYKGEEQNKLVNGYDHLFLFDNDQGKVELYEPLSRRMMTIETNAPAVVMYTTNAPVQLNEQTKKQHIGVCFETQGPPASLWLNDLPSIIIRKDEKYKQRTTYSFTTQ